MATEVNPVQQGLLKVVLAFATISVWTKFAVHWTLFLGLHKLFFQISGFFFSTSFSFMLTELRVLG